MKQKRELKIVDFTKPENEWQVETDPDVLVRTGLASIKNKQYTLSGKSLYKDGTGKQYVFKTNSFNPHNKKDGNGRPIKLEIASAVNAFLWTKYAQLLGLNDILPSDLYYVITQQNTGIKVNSTVCSVTEYKEGYINSTVLNHFFPDIYEQNAAKLTKMDIRHRVFCAVIGKTLMPNDVLFNLENFDQQVVIDMEDASPLNIPATINSLFRKINAILPTKEEKINALNIGIELASNMAKYTEEVKEMVYAVYNKINLTHNPSEGKRESGLKLYEKIWMNLIPTFKKAKEEIEATGSIITIGVIQQIENDILGLLKGVDNIITNKVDPETNLRTNSYNIANNEQTENQLEVADAIKITEQEIITDSTDSHDSINADATPNNILELNDTEVIV